MHVTLKTPYRSIKQMDGFDLPDFAVLIGRNGVGKTQLLTGISEGHIVVSGFSRPGIELYNFSSFHAGDSGQASWGHSQFLQSAVERYFTPHLGVPLVEIAEKIFQEQLNKFGPDDFDERRDFDTRIRKAIRDIPDFKVLGPFQGDSPVTSYLNSIRNQVISKLKSGKGGTRTSREEPLTGVGNDQSVLVSLAMKLNGKLPHELTRNDLYSASNYEGRTIGNQLSQLFIRYKVAQYWWAHTEGERSDKSIRTLMREYRETQCPPWVALRSTLDRMRETSDDPELFNFEFSDPEQDILSYVDHLQYTFTTRFTNRSTGASYPVSDLSSGEKILLSMCFAAYNKAMGRRQPGLVLLDELDTILHPSMISVLVSGLQDQFVSNGTPVIMATHSVTTVSCLDEGVIFRVSRSGGQVRVRPVTRAEAVTELSEGLATIDSGLRIATSESAAPITLLSEGNNAKHLKKWADLFFPTQVKVFDRLPHRTGKNDLVSYGRLLARMETNSHFLVIWDCDASRNAEELRTEAPESSNVTAFAFSMRENLLSPKGIENLYDEEYLQDFVTTTKRERTGEVFKSIGTKDKADFAKYVLKEGTKDHFKHYSELEGVVQRLLSELS